MFSCDICNLEDSGNNLFWYKSKTYCDKCYPVKERLSISYILTLVSNQKQATKENSTLDETIMSKKQASFIRFIHMYSSSKELPKTEKEVQIFINKYKDEAINLNNKLKRLCNCTEQGYPILCTTFDPLEGLNYLRKIVCKYLDEDTEEYRDILNDPNYDYYLDHLHITE